jgi:DNA-binding response OmpR family regulator
VHSSRVELLLNEDRHEVITFHSAKEIWENFTRRRPRYIITNREFQDDFSALDLCRAVRKEFMLPYCYIHILSRRSQLEEIEEALEAGANDYSILPISPFQLRARVRVGLRWLAYIDSLTLEK